MDPITMSPGWIMLALSGARMVNAHIRNQPSELTTRFGEIADKLEAINARLDEQVLNEMRVGVKLLADAINTADPNARRDQLQLARGQFARLVALDSDGTTSGESLSVNNRYLNCVGYWGNYHYFVLSDDYKMALAQAYECALLDPLIALSIFDDRVFAERQQVAEPTTRERDRVATAAMLGTSVNRAPGLSDEYGKLMKKRARIPFTTTQELDDFVAAMKARIEEHEQKQTYRTIISYVLGVGAGVLATPFTFIGGAVAFAAVSQAIANSGGDPPTFEFTLEQVPGIRKKIANYEKAERTLIRKTKKLANERLAELQTITPGRMKQLVAAAAENQAPSNRKAMLHGMGPS